MPTPRQPSAASRVLWPVTALLALAGVVVLALGMAGSAGRVTTDMVGFHEGQQVQVPETGMSVWSRSAESRAGVVCLLDGTPMLRPVSDFSVEVAGQRFHETARTPEDLAAGTYVLECPAAQTSGADEDDAGAAGDQGADGRLYVGPYGPGAVATGLLGGAGVTLGLVLLPLALVCGLLAWAAGRKEPAPDEGPDPAAYTLPEQHAGTAYTSPYASPQAPQPGAQQNAYTSPYASPQAPQPGGQGTPYGSMAPPSGQPVAPPSGQGTASTDEPPPFPTGGPFSAGLPPRPVSTGHDDEARGPADGDEPPSGPRYDLPPPS